MRGDRDNDQDNKAILQKIMTLREERCKMLGYPTPAHFFLENRMAKTPANSQLLPDAPLETGPGAGQGRSGRDAGAHRPGKGRLQAGVLGLVVLCREAAQGQV